MLIKAKEKRDKSKWSNTKQNSNNHDSNKDDNNKRLQSEQPTNNEGTAAWQNIAGKDKDDNVSKPSLERVIDAKDWVDNGSKL